MERPALSSPPEVGDHLSTRKAGKRPRKPNYTHEELQLLIHTVHHNYELLYGEGQRKNDRRRREVWQRLAAAISGRGAAPRTKDELQHKYRDLRAEVKRKLCEGQRGGGGTPASLTLLERMIAANITQHNRGSQRVQCGPPGGARSLAEAADRAEEEVCTPGLEIEEGVIKEEELEESTSQDTQEEESTLFAPPSWFLDYERVPILGQDAQEASVDLSESLLERRRTQPDGKPVDPALESVSREREEAIRPAPTTPASTSTASDGELGRGWSNAQSTEHASWRLTLRRLYELEERREVRHQQHMQLQRQHVQLQQDILEQQKTILQTIQNCMQLQVEQQERHHQDLMSVLRSQQTTAAGSSPSAWSNQLGHASPANVPKLPFSASIPRGRGRRGRGGPLNTNSFIEESPTVNSHTTPEEAFETPQETSASGRGRGRGRRGRGRPRGSKSKKT